MEGSSTAAEGSADGVHKQLVMRRATLLYLTSITLSSGFTLIGSAAPPVLSPSAPRHIGPAAPPNLVPSVNGLSPACRNHEGGSPRGATESLAGRRHLAGWPPTPRLMIVASAHDRLVAPSGTGRFVGRSRGTCCTPRGVVATGVRVVVGHPLFGLRGSSVLSRQSSDEDVVLFDT